MNYFSCSDDITKKLLLQFRQKDNQEKVFVKKSDGFIIARSKDQLINSEETLSEKIYYRPTYFPLISNYDTRMGSAWDHWECLNFDTECSYNATNDKITFNTIERNVISLELYMQKLQKIIDNNVTQILKKTKNLKLFLAYSGGIDSILLLSYFIKEKLQDKISLINYRNLLTKQSDSNFDYEKKLGFDIKTIVITVDDLVDVCNTMDYEKVLCYTTCTLLKKFKKVIFGFHGNQSLLHKKIFLEQINKDVINKGYCSGLNEWKSGKNSTPLSQHCLVIRPWKNLNLDKNQELFMPLGNDDIFELIRSIGWKDIDPHVISDAKVARKIIHNNVGDLLDPIICEESLNSSDVVVGDLEIPMEKLNKKIFNLERKNYHNAQGYDWLLSEYNLAKEKNYIKFNSLIAFLLIRKYF
jgi:hypothetical protein